MLRIAPTLLDYVTKELHREANCQWWPNGTFSLVPVSEKQFSRSEWAVSCSRLRVSVRRQQMHVAGYPELVERAPTWHDFREVYIGSGARCSQRQGGAASTGWGLLFVPWRRLVVSWASRVPAMIFSRRKQCCTPKDLLLCCVTLLRPTGRIIFRVVMSRRAATCVSIFIHESIALRHD